MDRLSYNLGASISWNPQGLSKPVMGLLYLELPTSIIYVYEELTTEYNTNAGMY
jgi:hypothetical protein